MQHQSNATRKPNDHEKQSESIASTTAGDGEGSVVRLACGSSERQFHASHVRSIQVHPATLEDSVGLASRKLTKLGAIKLCNGATDTLRVGDQLRAGSEDPVRDADWRAGERVVEVDDSAVEGCVNGGVSTSQVVDEGYGCHLGCR